MTDQPQHPFGSNLVNLADARLGAEATFATDDFFAPKDRMLNPEPAGTFSKIGIQLEIGGQIQQLANLIKGIETSPKLLVVDELNVRSLFRPAGLPQPQGVAQPVPQNLRISLTVVGFARAQPANAPAKESEKSSADKTS